MADLILWAIIEALKADGYEVGRIDKSCQQQRVCK